VSALSLAFDPGVTVGDSMNLIARWAPIATRTVYFGHQSVGNDVLAGVRRWNDELALGVRLVQTRDPASVTGPALVHFLAGQNGDFASKNAALLRFLDGRSGADNAIVLLKYCYVDVHSGSDVRSQFDEYLDTAATIAVDHPDAVLVHTTIPITSIVEGPIKARAKHLLGRNTLRAAAVRRHRYNAFVRAEFSGREPLFDIALAESTRPDGKRDGFVEDGEDIETLAPEYTSDGGHLNGLGQRTVAASFLNALAEVSHVAPSPEGVEVL
jgi:hypothetical protein